jgi:hypothetical protein
MLRSGLRLSCTTILAAGSILVLWKSSPHAQAEIPNMPLPEHAIQGTGSLLLDRGLRISFEGVTEPLLERARDSFLLQLSRETGILRWPVASTNQPRLIIRTEHARQPVEQLGEDESLQPLLAHSALTAEFVPVSHNLSQMASIGLDALSSLQSRKATPVSVQQQQLAFLKENVAPQAVFVDALVPGVEILVRASGQ